MCDLGISYRQSKSFMVIPEAVIFKSLEVLLISRNMETGEISHKHKIICNTHT